MTLQEILDLINYVANKEQSGNTLSIPQYNNLLKTVNIDYFKLKYGLPEDYRVGMPLARQAWENTQAITDALRRFKVIMGSPNAQMTVSNNGIAVLPTDYVHVSSIRYIQNVNNTSCGHKEYIRTVEVITDDQLSDRLSNNVKKPSYRYPVAVFYNSYVQFYPKDLHAVDFTYLRLPLTPYYDFYMDTNDNVVYLPPNTTSPITGNPPSHASQSVELEWGEECHIDIARLLLSYIGINLREVPLLQYAEMKKKEGV